MPTFQTIVWTLSKQELKPFKALPKELFFKLDKVVHLIPQFHGFTIGEILSQENPHKPIPCGNRVLRETNVATFLSSLLMQKE